MFFDDPLVPTTPDGANVKPFGYMECLISVDEVF